MAEGERMTRREFSICGGAALGALCARAAEPSDAGEGTLKLRFLGTGAADWNGRDERGEHRRFTSILVEGRTLVDFTSRCRDMIPDGCRPDTVFYTHSHGDHYGPKAAVALGVRRAYVHESWAKDAEREFRAAAEKANAATPEVLPLSIGTAVEVDGVRFTALPANHATGRLAEQTIMYLVEKGPVRLLYATDTGGIPARAAQIAGIDMHIRGGKPITALVMEATMGLGYEDDFRIYTHSSVATVAQIVRVLEKTHRYAPAPGQPVWLTHMARTLHGTQAELDAKLPKPLCAAYDGLEIELRAKWDC